MSPAAVPGQPLLCHCPHSEVVLVQPLTVPGVNPTRRKAGFSPGVCVGLVPSVVPRNSCNGTTGGVVQGRGERGLQRRNIRIWLVTNSTMKRSNFFFLEQIYVKM